MPAVKISKGSNSDKPAKLENGTLIIVRKTESKKEVAFMVTSWLERKGEDTEAPNKYCSFVNLTTGGKAFAEPSSRTTTYNRIAHHLSNTSALGYVGVANITIIPKDAYEIDIKILE